MVCGHREVVWCVGTAGSRIVYAYREVEWCGDTEKGNRAWA